MKSWDIKKLGEVCSFFNGQAHEKCIDENGKFKLINSKFVSSEGENFKNTNYALSPLFVDDIVMVMSDVPNGKTLAKCFIVDKDDTYTLNQRICVIRSKKFIPRFLYYQLNRNKYFLSFDNGENQSNLRKNDILNCKLFIPSLSEQQEIVSILDNAFESIELAKSNAEQNLKNVKELFVSYLTNIFRNNKDGWVTTTIGEVCNLQTGGTPSTSKKEYYEGGDIKWLVSGDINQKEIYDCEGRITQIGMNNSNTKILPVNSVLIALNGQGKTRGTVAMLRTKATCNQSLVSIFPKNERELLPELVFSNLEGRYEEIRKMTGDSGNDRRGLNMPLIRGIKFSYPKSISIQKEVICKLDLLRKETSKLESIYKKKLNDLEELKKSILQMAFNGELKTSKISA
jgi:type I restriction enzyme S subunit